MIHRRARSVTRTKSIGRLVWHKAMSAIMPTRRAKIGSLWHRNERRSAIAAGLLTSNEALADYNLNLRRLVGSRVMRRKIPLRRELHRPTDSIASCKDMPLEVNDAMALDIVALSAARVRLMLNVTVSFSASDRALSISVARATMVP